jgi:hypothetical protein
MDGPDPAFFTPEFDLEVSFKVSTCPFDLEMGVWRAWRVVASVGVNIFCPDCT